MKVLWTEPAEDELKAVFEYVTESSGSQRRARKLIEDLLIQTRRIGTFPRSGRIVPEYQDETIREIIVAPYRVIYRIQKSHVEVLSVVHSAKLLPHQLTE